MLMIISNEARPDNQNDHVASHSLEKQVEQLLIGRTEIRQALWSFSAKLQKHSKNVTQVQKRVKEVEVKHAHRMDTMKRSMDMVEDGIKSANERLAVCTRQLKRCDELLQESKKRQMDNDAACTAYWSCDESVAIAALKELCWQVTTLIYRSVFPETYASRRRYSFSDVRCKISRLSDESQREEKTLILNDLLKQIAWSDDVEHTVQRLLDGYALEPTLKQLELTADNIELIFACDILDSDEEHTVRYLVRVWQTLNSKVRKNA